MHYHATAQEIYDTMAHEFGHIIKEEYWGRAPSELKTLIKAEFDKFFAEQAGMMDSLETAVMQRNNFISIGRNTMRIPPGSAFEDLSSKMRKYWLDFDQWFAEQTARWMTTDAKPLNVVEKFFAKLAGEIRRAYTFFQRKWGVDAEPNAVVKAFLDTLLTQPDVPAVKTYRTLDKRTKRENQVAIDEDGGSYDAAPMQESTILPREMFSNILGASPPPVQAQAKAMVAHADRFNWLYNLAATFIQLADANPNVVPLQRGRELWQLRSLEAAEVIDGATATVKKVQDLSQTEKAAWVALTEDYQNMAYLTPQEVQQGVERLPTQQEIGVSIRKHKANQKGCRRLRSGGSGL